MSKKLIAVASAAALALTALVAMPSAAVGTFGITEQGANTPGGNGLTADSAWTINVPSGNFVNDSVASDTALRIEVTTPGTLDTVRVSSSGGVKVLAAATFDALAADKKVVGIGASSAEAAGTAASAGVTRFVLYTTSTTATKVTVTSGTQAIDFWIQGENPVAYNVEAIKVARSLYNGVPTVMDLKVTDAFGNVIEEGVTTASISTVGPIDFDSSNISWDADRKVNYVTVEGSEKGIASFEITAGATKVTAFGTPKVVFGTVSIGDTLADVVEVLESQIAALEAKVANKVTKKRFNRLARKWNAQNPNDRVKLKK